MMSLLRSVLTWCLGTTTRDWLVLYSGHGRYGGNCNCKPLPGPLKRWIFGMGYGAVLECKHGLRWILKEDPAWPGKLDWTYHQNA
jgi:hypothetical protein